MFGWHSMHICNGMSMTVDNSNILAHVTAKPYWYRSSRALWDIAAAYLTYRATYSALGGCSRRLSNA